MPVEIQCRYVTSSFLATAKGHKPTASNSVSARQAAEALCKKLSLDPAYLVEQQRDLLRDRTLFVHSGEQA